MKYEKMDPIIKAKWIKNLVSGKFMQGEFSLKKRDDNGNIEYCCLGVLTDILQAKTKHHWTNPIGSIDDFHFDQEGSSCPVEIAKLAGLGPKAEKRLIALNDGPAKARTKRASRPRTFLEIAAFIERYL